MAKNTQEPSLILKKIINHLVSGACCQFCYFSPFEEPYAFARGRPSVFTPVWIGFSLSAMPVCAPVVVGPAITMRSHSARRKKKYWFSNYHDFLSDKEIASFLRLLLTVDFRKELIIPLELLVNIFSSVIGIIAEIDGKTNFSYHSAVASSKLGNDHWLIRQNTLPEGCSVLGYVDWNGFPVPGLIPDRWPLHSLCHSWPI